MSYQPDFRPQNWSDIGSALTAIQSQRIQEAADATRQLLQLEATSKKREGLQKEILFIASKSIEEIPKTLQTNPVAGIIEIEEMNDVLRSSNIESSTFDTLEYKELAHRVWTKLDELEKHCLANFPDLVIAYEKMKKQKKEQEDQEKEQERIKLEEKLRQGKKTYSQRAISPLSVWVWIILVVAFIVFGLIFKR